MSPGNMAEGGVARKRTVTNPRPITKLTTFKARCEARAILYAACEFDLHEAVDALQAHALASGLVDEIGQDAVQATISEPFGRVR